MIDVLLGNGPVNTFQHTPRKQWRNLFFYAMTSRNNGGSCVFYVVTSPTIKTVFSMVSVQSAYKRSEFTRQLSSGQLLVFVDQKLVTEEELEVGL
jgi:hypothetical protein